MSNIYVIYIYIYICIYTCSTEAGGEQLFGRGCSDMICVYV